MKTPDDEPEIRKIDPANIQPGPLRREALTPDLEKRAREVHKYLSPFLNTTFEQFEIAFLRDSDPASEIEVWSQIVEAHRAFVAEHPEVAADGGMNVFKSLLIISMCGPRPPEVPEELWDELNRFVDG